MSRNAGGRAKRRAFRNSKDTSPAMGSRASRREHKGARADLMPGSRRTGSAHHTSKDVPRFAPWVTGPPSSMRRFGRLQPYRRDWVAGDGRSSGARGGRGTMRNPNRRSVLWGCVVSTGLGCRRVRAEVPSGLVKQAAKRSTWQPPVDSRPRCVSS